MWIVDIESGPESARQLTGGDWDDLEPSWSPDGALVAFVADRSASRWEVPRREVWVVAPSGRRRPRQLTKGRGAASAPLFSPDGATVAYVGHEHQAGDSSGNVHLMVVSSDGSRAAESLSGGLDRSVMGTFPLAARTHGWTPDGSALFFVANDGGAHQLYRVPVDASAPPAVLVGGDRQVTAVHVAAESVVFTAGWPSRPVEVYRVGIDGSGEHQVSDANRLAVGALRFVPTRRLTHRASDGSSIESFVLYPPGFKRGVPAPTVLEIHGGPHGCHPQMSLTPLYQALAGAGYVVVLPNPRGSQGYGEEWSGRVVGDWGGGDFGDLMAVMDGLVERGVADPERLYVAGYSYGGYMTTWTVGHTDRFKAACISAPSLDLLSMYGTTDIPFFADFELAGTPWERPEFYRERSPITYLPEITTPVQLLHWDGDLRCPVSQADELFQGLRRLGREAVLVRYPGGFHVARTPSQMVDFVQRHLDWFAGH